MITLKNIQSKGITVNLILYLMFISMLGDYCITYWGIHSLNVISEANPLMVNFMNLPFLKGISFRIITSLIPIILLKSVERAFENKSSYVNLLMIILSIQIYPYSLHFYWILQYFFN